MDNPVVHRPRNVGWQRAAGLLYGDWGTSKAYVIGLAFATSGYASMPIILAVCLALPMVIVVLIIIGLSLPHLTMRNLQPSHQQFLVNWQAFVGVILALSGVEAIANLTGVMNLDPGSTLDKPRVASTARKAIWPVACEVVVGTPLLGWAMLSLPPAFGDVLRERRDDMLRFLAEHYGSLALGSTGQGSVPTYSTTVPAIFKRSFGSVAACANRATAVSQTMLPISKARLPIHRELKTIPLLN